MATMDEISQQIKSAGMAAEQKESLEEEKLPGGIGDNIPVEQFDASALEKGIQVELEHTNDRAVAEEIAKDHLTEDKNYYDKLEEVDKEVFTKMSAK